MRYPNLQRLLSERRISSRMYAQVIETSQATAANKIRGDVDHTVAEAKRAMTLFPEYLFDYVFCPERESSCEDPLPDER